MSLCLNMIVRNESARIVRALDSAKSYINYLVVVDTGSTDGTQQIIADWAENNNIKYVVGACEFKDFSYARNTALEAARRVWRDNDKPFSHILLFDADMELRVDDPSVFDNLDKKAYYITQIAGSTRYVNMRIIRADAEGQYRGVTHEFLDIAPDGNLPFDKVLFVDHADGSNRLDKFKRDILLLKRGLKDEPKNERYMFYLAQSYRDAGKFEKAAKWYQRRIDAGGWPEEVYQAKMNLAHMNLNLGDEGSFIRGLLNAYNFRPSRAEALYDLAHYYRLKGENATALMLAEQGLHIPVSNDTLFVNDFVYEAGLAEEVSICAFYMDHKKPLGFMISDQLALKQSNYLAQRELAKSNLYFYLPKLSELAPSFKAHKLNFEPPEGWVGMNPSITTHSGKLLANIRVVNYRMDEEGRYLIRGLVDGTVNDTNPINTRNFIAAIDQETLQIITSTEIAAAEQMPIKFPLVIGFEDNRLISHNGKLFTSSTVRQLEEDGQCVQVLSGLTEGEGVVFEFGVGWYCPLTRSPRVTEKNWSPWVHDGKLEFMYKPGHVVDEFGQDVKVNPATKWATDDLRGSGPILTIGDIAIGLVHEARHIPGTPRRHYWHRFVSYDPKTAEVTAISRPFVFNDKQIEFAAGMTLMDDKLIISYGVRDCEAWLATVNFGDVMTMLWRASRGQNTQG